MNKPVPKHLSQLYGSAHLFRSAKRKQVRDAIEAVNDLRMGCAFFPDRGYENLQRATDELEALKKLLSTRNWGR